MKKTLIYACAAIVLMGIMLGSCKKEENSGIDPSSSQQLKSGVVFTVSPSGNYTDDSYNIQEALNDAVAAGPGNTVHLTEGTFYLASRIEIDGFDGYFTGAGKDNTIITTHDQIVNDITNDDWYALLKFRHGNLHMSDLSFEISLAEPLLGVPAYFYNAFPSLIMVTGNSTDNPPTANEEASASFDNINFTGGAGFRYGVNISNFIWIGAEPALYEFYELTDSEYSFTKCHFRTGEVFIINWTDENTTWIIGGNGSDRNIFEDAMFPIQVGECSNSTIEISYNDFIDLSKCALAVFQGLFFDPATISLSSYYIHHNNIEIVDYGDGMMIIDESYAIGGDKLMDAVISNNQIHLVGAMGGIYGEGGKDIIVTGNKIWGNSEYGIYLPTWWETVSTNWFIKGNNLQNDEAEIVQILLGSGTNECTVIGGSNKTNVIDQGTNNYLSGVTIIEPVNPGQGVQEAMILKHEIIKQFIH